MTGRVALTLLLVACAAGAQQNLIPNGDFSAGLEGWVSSRGPAQPVLDTEDVRSAPAALRLPGTAEMVGMVTAEDITFAEPRPNALSVSGWVKASAVDEDAGIGIDLKIVLDDGATIWFFPTSLMARSTEAGQWAQKTASYLAPSGRRIAAIAVFCLNYRSGGATAWFDDIDVRAHIAAAAERDVAILYARAPDEPDVAATSAALSAAGIEHDLLPLAGDFGATKLVALPTWIEDEALYYRLKVFHYLGGRVLLLNLPDSYFARGLARYFWDAAPAEITEPLSVSVEGRAAHLRPEFDLAGLGELVTHMMVAKISLPDKIPAIDFGAKAPYAIRDGALVVGAEPLLFRAMGTYAVNGTRPIAQDAANFAHYARDLRLNGIVLYLDYCTEPEHLRAVLDAAWAEGLRVVMWIHGPAVSGYSEKPLKDEWLLRFLPLRRHPAWLAWEIADDTWSRHLEFVERTAQVIRRYDRENLITTTLMDLRRPENVPETTWARWRALLDFPLTYLYPLQKGRTYGGGEDIEGGLEDVQRLSAHAQAIFGADAYVMQWSQAHMQGPAYPKVGIPPRSTYLPTPEQQRLLTYMMLTAGTRGILYFSTSGLADDRLGMGRRAELGLLWGELESVQDIVAGGTITACATSEGSVEARAFTRGGETVVLALKHGPEYHRYVSDAVVEDLTITLPFDPPADARLMRLDGSRSREVARGADGRSLTLDALDMTAALLITADEGRIAELEGQRQAWPPLPPQTWVRKRT